MPALELIVPMLAAVSLDRLLGEPRRFHPLAGFGQLTKFVEKHCYRANYISGVLSVCILLITLCFFAFWLQQIQVYGLLFAVIGLYFAIAPRSLAEHAMRVTAAFAADDLSAARAAVSRMVSRDTTQLDEAGVSRATVESVLENGNDAIFAALFWFVVAGLPGVVLYRLANTLDAMWGYRNQRYNEFGWAAARLDDVLNYFPARLTALSYTLLGNTRSAWHCWRRQAPVWDSPNAGPVMAAGAGALQVKLGGAAIYHGQLEQRPELGCGSVANRADIVRAVRLVRHTLYLWLAVISLGALLIEGFQYGA
ncbi:MAG: adenosylcobinamide-phosphate synthase CbiB [Gallionella sp.]|nr:adenosylcobinamide-phosphate synthase CbiB [Gallionella sp.]